MVGSDTDNTDTDDQQDSLSDNEEPTRKSMPVIDGNKESSPMLSNLRDRFATALDVKQEISNVSTTTFPWLPVASDLNLDSARSITPPKLFNMI